MGTTSHDRVISVARIHRLLTGSSAQKARISLVWSFSAMSLRKICKVNATL